MSGINGNENSKKMEASSGKVEEMQLGPMIDGMQSPEPKLSTTTARILSLIEDHMEDFYGGLLEHLKQDLAKQVK
uniref:NepR domain-containing protein n=1 Tax=Caenorhabditis tropicalis TaxID=1561998 RepID=A0A1I7THY3_9PELO